MVKKNRHMSKKMDIIYLFLRDYSASFSGREIARGIGVSPQTALNHLNGLVQEKILGLKKEGRNNKYYLNKKDLRTKLHLEAAEINKARVFLEKFELKSIVNSLLPLAETLIVFGSFAKGKEKKSSDIDLVMIEAKDKKKANKIKKIFPREINIHFTSWKEFVKSLKEKNPLALEIKKDHLVYGNIFKAVNIYCED